jgi:hypothetical protein
MAVFFSKPLLIVVLASVLVVTLNSTAFAMAGDLDTTFGGDGKVTTNFTGGNDIAIAIAIQTDGKIVVGGLRGR